MIAPIAEQAQARAMTTSATSGRKSKKEILQAIVQAGEAAGLRLGGPGPSHARFEATSGITKTHWANIYWTKWGDALAEAGYTPNPWGAAKKDADELLAALAALTRDLGKVPTTSDLKFAYNNRRGGFPAHNTFRKLGRHPQLVASLREWVASKPEWADVAATLGPGSDADVPDRVEEAAAPPIDAIVSDSFLPPVLACLAALAQGDERIVEELEGQGRSAEKEFERRTAAAFRLMGLRVLEYGQGTGRKADGVAVCVPKSWAVVFDAKLRRELYKHGALEDRKFKEYIAHHGDELEQMGTKR